MKRFFTFFVLSAIAITGCKSATTEQKLAAYQETGRAIIEKFEDGTITEDEAVEQVVALGLKTIRQNKDNEIAIAALQDIYYLAEPEVLSKAIGMMSEENRNNEFTKRVSAGLDGKLATAEGKMFLDFEVGGQKFSDYVGKGKYILVDFWASWCGPCKAEIPFIKAVWEKYAGEEFDVLSIAVWDKPEDTAKAAEEHGVVWNQMVDAQRIPTDIYGIDSIPQIILFGPDGTIVKRNLRGEGIEAEVSKYVKAN